jgi:hypothetical protein
MTIIINSAGLLAGGFTDQMLRLYQLGLPTGYAAASTPSMLISTMWRAWIPYMFLSTT